MAQDPDGLALVVADQLHGQGRGAQGAGGARDDPGQRLLAHQVDEVVGRERKKGVGHGAGAGEEGLAGAAPTALSAGQRSAHGRAASSS